ncbi:MAG: MlaD family protein [Rhodospirillaceae bacterium]
MSSESQEQLIGAATLALLVLLMVSLNQSRDIDGAASEGVLVSALFGRVDGLVPGDDVQMGGVRIGTVQAQTLDAGYRAVVTLALDPGAVVPSDSAASIQTDGLFGGKFVVIEPGASEKSVKTGDRITRTQDAQVVGDLLDAIISEGRAALAQRRAAGQKK